MLKQDVAERLVWGAAEGVGEGGDGGPVASGEERPDEEEEDRGHVPQIFALGRRCAASEQTDVFRQ
mgnify:CR=1 FL=1